MALTYTLKENELGIKYVEMLDSEKPNSICIIPINESNSDYQQYLKDIEEGK